MNVIIGVVEFLKMIIKDDAILYNVRLKNNFRFKAAVHHI